MADAVNGAGAGAGDKDNDLEVNRQEKSSSTDASTGTGARKKEPRPPSVRSARVGRSVPAEEAPTPRLTCVAEVPPDTVDNVEHQAETVLRQFLFERYNSDQEHDRLPPSTPSAPELTQRLPPVFSQEAAIGRQLAMIGDDIQQRYSPQFTEIMKTMHYSGSNAASAAAAYDTFRTVVSRLFRDGNINWGRVVALFCFGYRMALHQLSYGYADMIKDLIDWILQFMTRNRISHWIAEHGGWNAVMNLMPESVDVQTLLSVASVALAAVALTMVITWRSS